MTPEQATEALLFHSGAHERIDDPRWEYGFLGSLRPFSGLREANFHEVMEALRVLAPSLQQDLVPRAVVAALLSIAHLGRAWGVDPDGMLRGNKLISDADVARLEQWTWSIAYATTSVLEGATEAAFEDYDRERASIATP